MFQKSYFLMTINIYVVTISYDIFQKILLRY